MYRLATFSLSILICLAALAASADAAGGGQDNIVSLTTTAQNPTAEQSSMRIDQDALDTIDNTNEAHAYSHDCTGCRTVAVAVQVLFATGHPTTVTPHNYGVALNERCTSCQTLAFAYQDVVTTDGPVHLTHRDRRTLSQLRQEFAAAAASDLPLDQVDARLHQLGSELKADVNQALERAREPHHATAGEHASEPE